MLLQHLQHLYLCVLTCVQPWPIQELTKQLDEVKQDSEIVEIRQKEAECELEAARDRVQQQATEILLKASKRVLLLPNGLGVLCLSVWESSCHMILECPVSLYVSASHACEDAFPCKDHAWSYIIVLKYHVIRRPLLI